jgi:peptide/nickel transport system substrate-binding protein
MAVFRKRLVFWLIKAYINKWGKVIFLSFAGGLVIFAGLIFLLTHMGDLFPDRKEVIGIVGAYTPDSLPISLTSQFSHGLTKIAEDGDVVPDLATSWDVRDNGKTYIFTLREDMSFSDGQIVTSKEIDYGFADVTVERPDKKTIIFKLKNEYSPFLVTVARPIFKKGLKGIGEYKITNVDINGSFVTTLKATDTQDAGKTLTYIFYPNQEALKTAFLLGEVSRIEGLQDKTFENTDFEQHRNVVVEKKTNYTDLVTLFYDTKDSMLSDPNLRRALTYALPEQFEEGERSYLPYPPTSLFTNTTVSKINQDLEHAGALREASVGDGKTANITIKTLPRYKTVAEKIATEWKKAGVISKIEEVDSVPETFQVYLGDFNMPRDPDQYTLWHSSRIGTSNITRFDNKRIDKLLEDGRKTIVLSERKEIYNDFQRFLLEEAPASFLYFPSTYTITRK